MAYAGVLSDAPPSPLELVITGSAPTSDKISIGLKIINHSDQPIVIQRGIEIDNLTNFKWVATMAGMQAIASCSDFDGTYNLHAPVRIEAGAILDVVKTNGDVCGGQCFASCAKNYPLGSGSYQFVVVTTEGKRLPSPSFTVPEQ